MFFLLLIGCFGGSSSNNTATDTGWQDDFEWEDGTGDQSDDTTGTDTESGGSTDTDSDTTGDTDTNAEDTDSGGDTESGTDSGSGSDSSRSTYTVCLTDLDSDVVAISLDVASTTSGGDAAENWLVWQDGQDFPCANLTGTQDEIFEIDGLVTLDDGTTSEFVYGDGMWDNLGELEMTDHGSSCYVLGDHENDNGVYRCALPDIWGEP